LHEILRVGWTIAASTHETIERGPVIAAKLCQGCVGCLAAVLAGSNNAPVGRGEDCPAILECTRNPFHTEKILRSNNKWQVRSTAPERRRAMSS
jgi:hypothetical protein